MVGTLDQLLGDELEDKHIIKIHNGDKRAPGRNGGKNFRLDRQKELPGDTWMNLQIQCQSNAKSKSVRDYKRASGTSSFSKSSSTVLAILVELPVDLTKVTPGVIREAFSKSSNPGKDKYDNDMLNKVKVLRSGEIEQVPPTGYGLDGKPVVAGEGNSGEENGEGKAKQAKGGANKKGGKK